MRVWVAVLLSLIAPGLAQEAPPPFPRPAPNLLKLPNDMHLGSCRRRRQPKGHIFVYARGGRRRPAFGKHRVAGPEFGADGKFVREIGKNLCLVIRPYGAHR
jgi:hypothetical protein